MSPLQKQTATSLKVTMRWYTLLALVVSLWVTAANGKQDATFKLRLVPLSQGIWEDKRRTEPEIITKARKLGIDLQNPTHPLLVHSYRRGRLFYLFYKNVDVVRGFQQDGTVLDPIT